MVVGAIDHESGTRDITEVSGLRYKLPFTFIAAVLAAISMAGFPISLGYFAKEEIYLLFGPENIWSMLLVLVALIGNGLMMAAGWQSQSNHSLAPNWRRQNRLTKHHSP